MKPEVIALILVLVCIIIYLVKRIKEDNEAIQKLSKYSKIQICGIQCVLADLKGMPIEGNDFIIAKLMEQGLNLEDIPLVNAYLKHQMEVLETYKFCAGAEHNLFTPNTNEVEDVLK